MDLKDADSAVPFAISVYKSNNTAIYRFNSFPNGGEMVKVETVFKGYLECIITSVYKTISFIYAKNKLT